MRAIAASEIPVISAVGHEIDWALSDFAADRRAPTPSAAAEIAVPEKTAIEERIKQLSDEIEESIRNRTSRLRMMMRMFSKDNMEMQFRHIEQPLLMRFDAAKEELVQSMEKLVEDRRALIDRYAQILENCNPQTILDRGYAMVTDSESGKVIRDASRAKPGAKIEIRPAKGIIKAVVQ